MHIWWVKIEKLFLKRYPFGKKMLILAFDTNSPSSFTKEHFFPILVYCDVTSHASIINDYTVIIFL